MNAPLLAQVTLARLPFGAGRDELLAAVTEAIEQAHESGRVEGRLDVLLGETEAVAS